MKFQMLNKNNNGKKISVGYAIFLHKTELNRRKKNNIRRFVSKINLTDGLIYNVKKNINYCSSDDLAAMSRETIFKKKLDIAVNRRVEHVQKLKDFLKQQRTPQKQEKKVKKGVKRQLFT